MDKLIDLTSVIQKRQRQEEERDRYLEASEVLDQILNLPEGQVLLVFNIRGVLSCTTVSGTRFFRCDVDDEDGR